MVKTAEELYREREKRVYEAVQLKEPDRVPFLSMFHFFPAKYAGISFEQVMYDYEKMADAAKRVILDFDLDMYFNPFSLVAYGPMMEILDFKQVKWPGHGVASDRAFQFVEAEYMTENEYDAFLSDPSDYMLRTYFPRVSGVLEPLKALHGMLELYYFRVLTGPAALAAPEVAGALEALQKAGAEAAKMTTKMREFLHEMTDLGFPGQTGGVAYAPFDYIGDFFRGTRGIMLDMYRNPDKLIAAMEKVLPVLVRSATTSAKRAGVPGIFIPLHKGHHGLMSLEQFNTFFWPTLKELMLALIDEDLIPCPLFEGDYTSRLDVIKDIPKGKAVYWFEQTDVFKAKEVLGDRICIRGNVPAPLLCIGTPQEVRDYCKKLIDIVGKGGGFIMDGGIGIPDEAKIENVKAMADFTREYGVYK
jgi:uroporphyrinogen-III decarboxylase